jgi:hypothetical protein
MFFRLHGQMQRIISQGGSSIDIVLGDLYEDIHWILLISGNILTLVNAQSIIVFNLFLSNPKRLVRCLIISVYLILVSTLHRKKTLDRQNCWHCFDFDTKWHVDNNFLYSLQTIICIMLKIQDTDGETALIPSEIMRYSLDRSPQVSVKTSLRVLASLSQPASDTPGNFSWNFIGEIKFRKVKKNNLLHFLFVIQNNEIGE